jgi:hypothetical protein
MRRAKLITLDRNQPADDQPRPRACASSSCERHLVSRLEHVAAQQRAPAARRLATELYAAQHEKLHAERAGSRRRGGRRKLPQQSQAPVTHRTWCL